MTTAFRVPPELSATAPPEARGIARDGVRLLVARDSCGPDRADVWHARFTDLPVALRRGDLLVVNTSMTEPAAVDGGRGDGRRVVLHVSGPVPTGAADSDTMVVELRTPDGRRVTDAAAGEVVTLPRGVRATLLAGHPDPWQSAGSRLWIARIPTPTGLTGWLAATGRPIRYSYVPRRWPLADYQTVFATRTDPFGSAEMPSAARPFSPVVLAGLRARGVAVAEVELHTGVSSLEAGEHPLPERYRVPAATAAAVNATRAAGRRVVAVGTTAARAIETVAAPNGLVRAGSGWTELVLGPARATRVVNGLITGWHEPEASHLLLLAAVAGPALVRTAYAAALGAGYLWHEFGDSCLLLPDRARQGSEDCCP
ncbi:S-adenosylmethionine:tRNA ribosyltransferase-isomerase [Pseudonocardia sp. GCM10023141]|uniref:S-adenosylmethionine:tRNA ribosyltransferase-isomerase n=1 Tax=Pseudonocardia sp. GCM10023141 TaxID=3252653 RepID=UPI00360847BC